jgi:tetratricopeptide (TPR) repeat protein
MGGKVSMKSFSKPLACCALCLVVGTLQQIRAQTTGSTKRRVPADPAALELNRLLNSAQEAADKRDFETAAKNYQDYLAKKPDDAIAHYDLGYVYTALQRPDDAKAEYEKAIALDPKMGEAYKNLGLTLLPSDPQAAVAPLQKAAELLPEDPRTKWLLGTALERTGKPEPAIEQFQDAQKLDDRDVEIRTSLGRALLGAGRYPEAEATFRTALSMNPEGVSLKEAHLGLANSLIAQKKLEEGASEFGAYLGLAPNDTAVRTERASALVDLGKDDDALAELDRAATAGPEGLRALKLRSQIYWDKKQYDDAVPVLQKAVAIAPHDPDIPARLGRVYLAKKDYPSALRWLATAYNANPSANDLLAQVIEAEYLNKNYAEALAGLDALSRREQLPAANWYLRATCYDKLGQIAEALDAYQKFLELNRDENSDMYFVSTTRVRVLTRELKDKKR